MTIISAILVFILFAAISWRFPYKIPSWLFYNLEYFLIIIGFIGILAALSQIESEARHTKALTLTNKAEQLFGSILNGLEYRMDGCGVWWDVALDQTNKEPPACQVSTQCQEACRTAHMISQYRWSPIETDLSDWENFHSLICYDGNNDKPRDSLCNPTDKFLESLAMAKDADSLANKQLLSNQYILIVVQLLTGLGLGLEFGKIKNRSNK